MIDTGLSGRVALVTGANHGIGAAIARALASQGAAVYLTFFREKTRFPPRELEEAKHTGVGGAQLYEANQQQDGATVAEEIRSAGGCAASCELDLGDSQAIKALFDLCDDTFGEVDVLVNNHTYCALETFDPERVQTDGIEIRLPTPESIDKHFQVNARAYALTIAEYAARYRRRGWGRIVNISTDAAHAHVANISYAASKHAIESYTRSAAAELGKYGITINAVAPGPVQTGYIEADLEKEIVAGTPLGRVGRPDDIADSVVFLASEQARWITGQLLYVGGGWRMSQ